ncbi:hypothetical protein B0H17DRAFT_1144307 [Mycena rosella]|uniref:FAD/NAD(P)-binding domain-containing protein n=1 Tax=Mycena rosella TaxID=1033263 RepID=A0AAD7G317_MYCRO|nr:hypothetical protein B0H17DRAFT_1144307 [Mycena rosella]
MLHTQGLVALVTAVLNVLATSQTVFSSDDSRDGSQWTTFPHPIRRVAVIGAGPAGLQAASHLLSSNLSVRLFERAPSPGGNWFYTEATPAREPYPDSPSNAGNVPDDLPAINYYFEGDDDISLDERWREHWQPRPVWYDLVINGPSAATELPGVKYSAGTNPAGINSHGPPPCTTSSGTSGPTPPSMASSPTTLHALHPNLQSRATPPASEERFEKCNATSTWRLTLRRPQLLQEPNRIREDFWQEEFDAVVVATGRFPVVHVPAIQGIEDWSRAKLSGEWSMYHAQSYRHPERYSGKTVLIVGASITATDIARRISPFVHRLIVSVRGSRFRDAYGIDILLRWPPNAELVPEIAAFQPLVLHSAGISDGEIRLVNGTTLRGIDEVRAEPTYGIPADVQPQILLATGYRRNTFLPDQVNPVTLDNLHWTGHYIHDPTLAYATVSSPWQHGRYQSAAFAKVWAGTARLPSRARMWEDYSTGKYEFGDVLDVFLQEALELGGQFMQPLPQESREVYAYFLSAHWKKDWFTHDNYTRFDQLPASEWPKPGPRFWAGGDW